jgi:hypothetical protein
LHPAKKNSGKRIAVIKMNCFIKVVCLLSLLSRLTLVKSERQGVNARSIGRAS